MRGVDKMMYPYSYSYGILYYGREIAIFVAILLAVVLSIVLYFTFLSKKYEGKYKGAKGKIYNFLSFNKFYTEDIMKLLYVVSVAVLVVAGFAMMFTHNFISGLLVLVLGNVALRISYELIMMFIIMCRKTVSIDRKMDKITEFYSDDFGEGECCACDETIPDQECCSCQDCCCECDEQEINASDR